jgi:hypothetical protein
MRLTLSDWLYLHEPMEVMVDAAGVCLVYFYHWQKILIGYKDLVLMVQQARQKHTSAAKSTLHLYHTLCNNKI